MADPHSDIIKEKVLLREKMRFRRNHFARNLSNIQRMLMFRTLPSPLSHMIDGVGIVGAYIAFGSEPDIMPALMQKFGDSKIIALPWFADRKAPMQFKQWQYGDELVAGPFHILQPSSESALVSPELLLMPLLAFDRDFKRLGQGGGHYDRYLETHHMIRVGIAWSIQEVDTIPTETTDVPLDAIATETEWITHL